MARQATDDELALAEQQLAYRFGEATRLYVTLRVLHESAVAALGDDRLNAALRSASAAAVHRLAELRREMQTKGLLPRGERQERDARERIWSGRAALMSTAAAVLDAGLDPKRLRAVALKIVGR